MSINITAQERALLDAIASTEAPAYNVMYGHGWSGEDRTFSDYSQHPGKFWEIKSGPNKGQKSSAAGRYQFLGSTWKDIAGRYGLRDFSPQSQDIGAIALARENYRRATGRNLTVDLESGDPDILSGIGRTLSKTWTSLPSGIEQGQGVDKFVSAIQNPSRDNSSISTAMSQAAGAAGQDMLSEYQGLRDGLNPPAPTDPTSPEQEQEQARRLPLLPGYERQVAAIGPIQMGQVFRRTNYG